MKMLFQEEFADQWAEQQTHPGRTVKNTKILWESLIDDLGRSRRIFCSFRTHTEEDEEFPNELISDPAAPSNHYSLMHSPSRQKTKDGNGARANLGGHARQTAMPISKFQFAARVAHDVSATWMLIKAVMDNLTILASVWIARCAAPFSAQRN